MIYAEQNNTVTATKTALNPYSTLPAIPTGNKAIDKGSGCISRKDAAAYIKKKNWKDTKISMAPAQDDMQIQEVFHI